VLQIICAHKSVFVYHYIKGQGWVGLNSHERVLSTADNREVLVIDRTPEDGEILICVTEDREFLIDGAVNWDFMSRHIKNFRWHRSGTRWPPEPGYFNDGARFVTVIPL
jgi:hypothetical protein